MFKVVLICIIMHESYISAIGDACRNVDVVPAKELMSVFMQCSGADTGRRSFTRYGVPHG